MRGRLPGAVSLDECDLSLLHQVARSAHLPFFQVQRARVMLAMAQGKRVQAVAAGNGCDRTTIWRICQRYEHGGASRLFRHASRRGSPPRLSPPPASPDCGTGLPGTHRPRPSPHPLGQR
jgi:Winged helix-turn helix